MSTTSNELDRAIRIQELLPAVKSKFFGPSSTKKKVGFCYNGRWGMQRLEPGSKDVTYFIDANEIISDRHLVNHFLQKPVKSRDHTAWGSFALQPMSTSDDTVYFNCIDADDPAAVFEIDNKLLPKFDAIGLQYIREVGGAKADRAHYWFFTTVDKVIHDQFFHQLLADADIDWKALKLELYPSKKPRNLIRLMGGLHLRAGYAHAISFNGVMSADPIFVMESIRDCKPFTHEEMLAYLATNYSHGSAVWEGDAMGGITHNEDFERKKRTGDLTYDPLKLKQHFQKRPPRFVRKVTTECQAFNYLAEKISKQDYLNDTGEDVHKTGLYFASMIRDGMKRFSDDEGQEEYEEWSEWLFNEVRWRDHFDHNWLREGGSERESFTPRCEKLDALFDKCGGCPLRYQIENPREIMFAKKAKYKDEVTKDKLYTNEQIRKDLFTDVEILCQDYFLQVDDKTKADVEPLTLLLKPPLGVGKSHFVSETAVRYAKQGRKVWISVPDGRLAMEHKARIEKFGGRAFVVMSHKNLFKRLDLAFDCPYEEEIQDLQDLGVGTSAIKTKYCKGCKFEDSCPFPRQYVNAMKPEWPIIITQHAHFKAHDVMRILARKEFDVLFLDEGIIDNTIGYYKVKTAERLIIEKHAKRYSWCKDLLVWIDGGRPSGQINAKANEIYRVRKRCRYYAVPWQIPNLIRAYNNGQRYEKNQGVFMSYDPPNVGLTILTDATPDKEILQYVMNKPIKSMGDHMMVDIKAYNQGNQIIKVINGSTSKTAHKDGKYFSRKLHYIAQMARKPIEDGGYEGLTILITVYKSDVEVVKGFFKRQYPELLPRITVSTMAPGTNEWEDINVQFLLAGVHLNGRDLKQGAWEINNLENKWRMKNGKTERTNNFPYKAKRSESVSTEWVPTKVKLRHADGTVIIRTVEDSMQPQPYTWDHLRVHLMALGKTQQSMRIRFKDSSVKKIIDWSNRYLDGVVYTDVVKEEELFATIPQPILEGVEKSNHEFMLGGIKATTMPTPVSSQE